MTRTFLGLAVLLAGLSGCTMPEWTYRARPDAGPPVDAGPPMDAGPPGRIELRGSFVGGAVQGTSAGGAIELRGVLGFPAAIRGSSGDGTVTLRGTLW